jgi:hypothetical protein
MRYVENFIIDNWWKLYIEVIFGEMCFQKTLCQILALIQL